MKGHDQEPQAREDKAPAQAPASGANAHVKAEVAQCAGKPEKLAELLAKLPGAQRDVAIHDAHQMFGNGFVQQALAATQAEPRPEPKAEKTSEDRDAKHEPIATAAMLDGGGGGGPSYSYTGSESVEFDEGEVHVKETASLTISHGKGPQSFNLSKGQLTVGDEHMSVNLKSPEAAAGRGLPVSGSSVTVAQGHTSKTNVKFDEKYVGTEYKTSYTLHSKHGWSATFTLTTFAGIVPPHHKKHWWQKIPLVAGALAIAKILEGAAEIIVETAPEWGPIVVVAA
jgi:hypothetical protein